VLAHDAVTAELICDGFHVHPAMCRLAIAAKSVGGVMAITDGTAGAGLRSGTLTRLGGRTIRVSIRQRCSRTGRSREARSRWIARFATS
jgi:N-acetylglucosamine-6-phosphate deacetylase